VTGQVQLAVLEPGVVLGGGVATQTWRDSEEGTHENLSERIGGSGDCVWNVSLER
jgi:hypothetical protein